MKLQKEWGRFKYLLPVFLLFLISCSTSPEYRIEKLYIDGKTDCVKKCYIEKQNCEEKCEIQYQTCQKNAYKRAKDIYLVLEEKYYEKLKIYERLYREYLTKYDSWFSRYSMVFDTYQYYRNRCQKDSKDRYSCDIYRQINSELDHLRFLKPTPPEKPIPPDFKKILKQEKSICTKDCKCDQKFDICFSTCGGKIDIKKICIKNCVKENKN